jgi:hypothetical protein
MSILGSARRAAPTTLLATVSRGVGRAPARPWLPAGLPLLARLYRHGTEPAVGVPWLDEPGELDAVVSVTYASSAARTRGVVTGLDLRVEHPGGSEDLRLRRPTVRPGPVLVSATAYAAAGVPGGLLSLGARQCGAQTFELLCVAGDGEWRELADLRICPLRTG